MATKTKGKTDFKERLDGYREVPDRIVEFYEKYPTGVLTQFAAPEIIDLEVPVFNSDGDLTGTVRRKFIQYTAAAYREPGDPYPGVGTVWEPFPGSTPYTRDSEMANAETSAWGRALVAVGILSKGEKIASRDEVLARSDEPTNDDKPAAQATPRQTQAETKPEPEEFGLAEVIALTTIAASTPQAKGKPNTWATEAVNKRLAYFKKKGSDDPVQDVFKELISATEDREIVEEAAAAIKAYRERGGTEPEPE